MWIILKPFPHSDFIGITIHVVENTPPGLVFIRPDKRAMPVVMVPLLLEFFLPNIFVHLRASNPTIGRVCPCIVANPMGYDTIQ